MASGAYSRHNGCCGSGVLAWSLHVGRPSITQAGSDVQSVAAELVGKLALLLFERYGDIQVLAEIMNESRPNRGQWTEHFLITQFGRNMDAHAHKRHTWESPAHD